MTIRGGRRRSALRGGRLLPIVLLPLLCVGAGQSGPGVPAIDLRPVVESAAPAGDIVRLALQVTVPPGLHVQSDKPRDPTLIPLTLTPELPPGFELVETVFPPSTDFSVAGYDQPLAVFENEFVIGVRVRTPKNQTPGSLGIPGKLRYQACNDRNCFPPKTVEATWPVTVVRAGTHPKAAHADVFRGIAFGSGTAPVKPAAVEVAPSVTPEPSASISSTPQADLALFDQFTVLNAPGGYMNSREFLTFIKDAEQGVKTSGPFEGRGPLAILALVFVGGLALNLTPCVLPMIPINLAIIGAGSQSRKRSRGFLLGATYGAAMAVAYGALGLIVILTAGTFGTINASAWFNFGIAALFVVLGLAMFDVVSVDFSRYSSKVQFSQDSRGTFLLAFGMGGIAALLAGACVAPVVIQVVVFASNLYARGTAIALALPFVLGLGMALPWPIAGAGFSALPKPGAWMVRVKQAMGVFILASAAYYGYLGYEILANRWVDPASVRSSVEDKLKEGWHASLADGLREAQQKHTPVLIDLWATWCKNCLVMDKTTLEDAAVKSALSNYTRIKVQAEDVEASPVKEIMQRIGAYGLPAYAILKPK